MTDATLTFVPAPEEVGVAERTVPIDARLGRDAGAFAPASRMGRAGALFGAPIGRGRAGPGTIIAGPLELLSALGTPVVAAAGAAAVAWITARNGRKVKLKIGDTEAEARTKEEVVELLQIAKTLRDKPPEGGP